MEPTPPPEPPRTPDLEPITLPANKTRPLVAGIRRRIDKPFEQLKSALGKDFTKNESNPLIVGMIGTMRDDIARLDLLFNEQLANAGDIRINSLSIGGGTLETLSLSTDPPEEGTVSLNEQEHGKFFRAFSHLVGNPLGSINITESIANGLGLFGRVDGASDATKAEAGRIYQLSKDIKEALDPLYKAKTTQLVTKEGFTKFTTPDGEEIPIPWLTEEEKNTQRQ